WIMDHKDNWENFIRPPLRALLAHRFRDAAGFTANAELHRVIAARYHKQPSRVIYSGVVPEMMAPAGQSPNRQIFHITLVGSIGDRDQLERLVRAFRKWLLVLSPSDRCRVELAYAGPAVDVVGACLGSGLLPCRTRLEGYLRLDELGKLCQSAVIN